MRRLLTALLVLVTLPATATTISVVLPTTGAQEARALAQTNRDTCASVGLPSGCTNAQVQSRDSSKVIYADVAGMVRAWAIEHLRQMRERADALDTTTFAAAAAAATNAQKNAACAAVGLAAGCLP